MAVNYSFVLSLLVVLALLPSTTYAFGAGDIPDFAYLNNKAFRHGDIENILEELAKVAGSAGGGGLLGFASNVLSAATGGKKFSKSDVKRVYFGNWLRDYSQAVDIAGLSKLSHSTIVMVVSVLGFLAFGFATEEFEVTADRLGVYLPVEHIDNPKGYAVKEGDARQFNPKLRPPVEDEELEIDENTGMKKYMATEGRQWDTSTAYIRRQLEGCIEHGRRAKGQEGNDLWEAYRLLGGALHTLEDLLAHSNWCEIGLRKLGHSEVFCHVGDNVEIDTPNGRSPPLVTGTFGGSDFMHSLMGETTDKLSQASVVEVTTKMEEAKQGDSDSNLRLIKTILGKVGGGGQDETVQKAEDIKAQAFDFNPDNYAPEDVQKQLMDILRWRDETFRNIQKKVAMIPGLEGLLEELTNALNAYVFTLIEPWLTPILKNVSSVLDEGSKAVIDSDDQYAVFNDSNASDPSHSMLSKDHFGLILNEPAGKIAKVVVQHAVKLIVSAWFDDGQDVRGTIDRILEAFHHPYYASGNSDIQNQMIDCLRQWLDSMEDKNQTIELLSKESVRDHRNKRPGSEGVEEPHGHSHGPTKTVSASQGAYGGRTESHQDPSWSAVGHTDEYRPSYGASGGYGSGGGQEEQSTYQSSQEPSGGYGASGGYESNYGSSYTEGGARGGYGSTETSGGGYGSTETSGGGYGSYRQPESENRDQEYGESRSNRPSGGYGYDESSRGDNDNGHRGGGHGYGGGGDHGHGHRSHRHHGGGEHEEHEGDEGGGYSYENTEETYGAERLNINDNENQEEDRGYGY